MEKCARRKSVTNIVRAAVILKGYYCDVVQYSFCDYKFRLEGYNPSHRNFFDRFIYFVRHTTHYKYFLCTVYYDLKCL